MVSNKWYILINIIYINYRFNYPTEKNVSIIVALITYSRLQSNLLFTILGSVGSVVSTQQQYYYVIIIC